MISSVTKLIIRPLIVVLLAICAALASAAFTMVYTNQDFFFFRFSASPAETLNYLGIIITVFSLTVALMLTLMTIGANVYFKKVEKSDVRMKDMLKKAEFEADYLANIGESLQEYNLAVMFADTYQRAQLARCIDILEVYAQDLDWTWNWIYYNLFEWRAFEARHAAVA